MRKYNELEISVYTIAEDVITTSGGVENENQLPWVDVEVGF